MHTQVPIASLPTQLPFHINNTEKYIELSIDVQGSHLRQLLEPRIIRAISGGIPLGTYRSQRLTRNSSTRVESRIKNIARIIISYNYRPKK